MQNLDVRGAFRGARAKLGLGDHADHNILTWRRTQLALNVFVLPESVDAGAGIEKKLHLDSKLASFLDLALSRALEVDRYAGE